MLLSNFFPRLFKFYKKVNYVITERSLRIFLTIITQAYAVFVQNSPVFRQFFCLFKQT